MPIPGSQRSPTSHVAHHVRGKALLSLGRLLDARAAGWLSHTPPASGIVPVASSTYLESELITGAHVSVWRVVFGAELAAGGRVTQFSPCASNQCGQAPESQSRWQLEARVRIDAFIAPRFSFGLSVGKSLIDANDTTYMVNFGAHIHAIDGMPWRPSRLELRGHFSAIATGLGCIVMGPRTTAHTEWRSSPPMACRMLLRQQAFRSRRWDYRPRSRRGLRDHL